jgi:hypothetical protein
MAMPSILNPKGAWNWPSVTTLCVKQARHTSGHGARGSHDREGAVVSLSACLPRDFACTFQRLRRLSTCFRNYLHRGGGHVKRFLEVRTRELPKASLGTLESPKSRLRLSGPPLPRPDGHLCKAHGRRFMPSFRTRMTLNGETSETNETKAPPNRWNAAPSGWRPVPARWRAQGARERPVPGWCRGRSRAAIDGRAPASV